MGIIPLAIGAGVFQGPEGTASVRGRIVDALSGKRVRNVVVTFYPQPRTPYAPGIDAEPPKRTAIADSDGVFEVARLVAADYSVSAGARGDYLSIEYGVKSPGGRSKLLKVTEGARLDITLNAWRGAAISGHVYDDRGRAVIGAQVRVFEKDSDVYGSQATDDLGAYEIARLRPGNYTVAVSVSLSNRTLSSTPGPPSQPRFTVPIAPYLLDRAQRTILTAYGAPLPPSADDGRAQIHTTAFAGGASSKAAALYVPLRAGELRENVDITLPTVRGFRISGLVTGPADITGTVLNLMPEGSPTAFDVTRIDATAAKDGTFVFVATPPGKYILTAHRRRPPLTEVSLASGGPSFAMDDVIRHDEEDYWAEMPFTVGDADVDDLTITLTAGTPLTGRAIYEDGGAEPRNPPRVTLAAGAQRFSDADRYIQFGRDGRVSMRLKPGRYRILSSWTDTGLMLKAMIVNGQEVGDEPLTVGADPIADVQFVFGRHNTLLRGFAVDRGGKPVADATAVLFPADRAQWFRLEESGRGRSARVTNGAWQFAGIPPGEYYVIALESFRETVSATRAAELIADATRVKVAEGPAALMQLMVKDPE